MTETETTGARLIAHVDCNKVTREQLAVIPAPEGTDSFKPIPFIELVDSLRAVLSTRGIEVVREQFALRGDAKRLFGTFDLSSEAIVGARASMGFRSGNDRTMKIQIVAGMNVTVCDNILLAGDSVILNRKHTAGLDLLPELMAAVTKFEARFARLKDEVADLMFLTLTDTEAKGLIHDAFMADLMPIRYLPVVSDWYFRRYQQEEQWATSFAPRTAYSLHNAFTQTAQEMTLNRRMAAIQGLGQVFGLLGKEQLAARTEDIIDLEKETEEGAE